MKLLPGLLLLAAGFLLGLWLTTRRLDERVKAHKARADSALAASDTLKLRVELASAERAVVEAENTRFRLQLTQRDTIPIPAERDTVRVVADSAALAATVDTLLLEHAQLHARIARDSVRLAGFARLVASQDTLLAGYKADLAAVMADRDSLAAVIRDTPYQGECRILDFIPCPTVTAGYGLQLSEGRIRHGPGATAGWEIGL